MRYIVEKAGRARPQYGGRNDLTRTNYVTTYIFLLRSSRARPAAFYLLCPSQPKCFPYQPPIRLCLCLSSCSFASQVPFVLALSQSALTRSRDSLPLKLRAGRLSLNLFDPLFFTYITSAPLSTGLLADSHDILHSLDLLASHRIAHLFLSNSLLSVSSGEDKTRQRKRELTIPGERISHAAENL